MVSKELQGDRRQYRHELVQGLGNDENGIGPFFHKFKQHPEKSKIELLARF